MSDWRTAPAVVPKGSYTVKPQAAPEKSADEGFMGFANRSIMETLLSPLDMVSEARDAAIRPIQGLVFPEERMQQIDELAQQPSETILDGLSAIGTPVAPTGATAETNEQRAGELFGTTMGMLPAFFGATRQLADAGGNIIQRTASMIDEALGSNPGAMMVQETLAAGGLAAGNVLGGDIAAGTLGEEYRDFGTGMGEVLGALALPAGVSGGSAAVKAVGRASTKLPVVGPIAEAVGDVASRTVGPGSYAERTARSELAKRMGDPEQALRNLDQESELSLTPMQRTGDKGLIAYERDIAASDPNAAMRMDIVQRESLDLAQEKLKLEEFLGIDANPMVAKKTAQQYVTDAKAQLDERLNAALDNAAISIERAAPQFNESPTENSATFARVVEDTFNSVRRDTQAAWAAVPQDDAVPTANMKSAYENALIELGDAGKSNLPAAARLLDENAGGPTYGEEIDGKELFSFYSAVTQEARQLRAAGNTQGARVADALADAALKDLEAHDATSEAYKQARAMTRAMHDRFTRGPIGSLRGYAKEGGAATSPYTYLDTLLTKSGGKERENIESLIAALGDPVNSPFPDQTRSAYRAAEDYVRNSFLESLQPREATLSPDRAETFVRRHNEIFEKYPALKGVFDNTIDNVRRALDLEKEIPGAARDLERSAIGRFGDSRTDKEFDVLLSSNTPADDIRDISAVLQASDPTGAALNGFKRAAAEYLIRGSRSVSKGDLPIEGNLSSVTSQDSGKLSKLLTTNRKALEAVFSPEEMTRLDRINLELRRLDYSRSGQQTPGDIVEPDILGSILGRFFGVRAAGNTIGQSGNLGAGAIQVYGVASRFGKSIADKLTTAGAERILRDALFDEQLFRSLITPPLPESAAQQAQRYVAAWLSAMPVSVTTGDVEESDNFSDDAKIEKLIEGLGVRP